MDDFTQRLGARLAARSSREGFLRVAGGIALGLGLALNGTMHARGETCCGGDCNCSCANGFGPINCCGCDRSGVCAAPSCDPDCGSLGHACPTSGCPSGCSSNGTWNCCVQGCRENCQECCCNGVACHCFVATHQNCGGGICGFRASEAVAV